MEIDYCYDCIHNRVCVNREQREAMLLGCERSNTQKIMDSIAQDMFTPILQIEERCGDFIPHANLIKCDKTKH